MSDFDWSMKRKKPYTEIGIRRLNCAKCGDEAEYQWNICSDGNNYRPLCALCDVKLNILVLAWIGHAHAHKLIKSYAEQKRVPLELVMDFSKDQAALATPEGSGE